LGAWGVVRPKLGVFAQEFVWEMGPGGGVSACPRLAVSTSDCLDLGAVYGRDLGAVYGKDLASRGGW
jgi:hypothetical protein